LGIEAALVATTLLAAGSAAYQAKRQRDVAGDERDRVKREEERLRKEMQNREESAQTQAGYTKQLEDQRKRQLIAGGFQSTIKTSPVGLPGGGYKYGKQTLIGGGGY